MGEVLTLKNSIEKCRQDMIELAGKNGLSDPQVIKVSKQLDEQIILWQKTICDSRLLSNGNSL